MKLKFCFLLSFLFLFWNSSRAQTTNGYIDINGPDTVCTGSSGFMTLINASSSPVFWQVTTNGGINWSTINNSNTVNSYFMAANNLCYRAVLANGDTSSISCLIVDDSSNAGVITGGAEFCGLANGTLSVSSNNGTVLGWLSSVNNGQSFLPNGNNSLSQNFSNLSQSTIFAFLVKNGVCPIDTIFDTVRVSPPTNVGTLLGNDTVCENGNQGFAFITGFTGSIVSWQESTNGGQNWNTILTNNDTLLYQNLSQGTSYQVIVQSGICPPDTTNQILIVTDNSPVAGNLSGGGYFCGPPASGTLILSGSSGNPTWYQSINNGSTWQTSGCSGSTCNFSSITGITLFKVELNSSFGACPSVFTTVDTVSHSPSSVSGVISASNDTICAFSGNVVLTLSGETGNSIIWQASLNGGTTFTTLTQYNGNTAFLTGLPDDVQIRTIVTNNNCPPDTSLLTDIVVIPAPTVTISTTDTIVEEGATINVLASGTGNPQWSPSQGVSNSNSFNTSISPNSGGYYFVTVSDGSGCTAKDSILISISPEIQSMFISNALTPNGDGINDEFIVEGILNYEKNSLKIFNEYGHLIFSESPYKNDWKGTYNNGRLPDGTYYYVLELMDTKKILKGSITLMSQK